MCIRDRNIIRALKSEIPSLGADCSSPGELHAAKLGGISSNDCIFTGNYESQEDLKIAFEQKAHINLDDITSFRRLKKMGTPKEISFRLNPGFGKGAFSQVVTGGKNSKFGVPKHAILDAYKMAKDSGVENFGIQCMTGSGILDHKYFPKLMKEILKTVELINKELKIDFHHISLGGGYGIPYSDDERTLDFNKVFNDVSEVFHSFYNGRNKPELWIEPGKSIIGDTGIILSKVTGIKKSYKNFIGIDAGMETLMRPALYGAYHRIYKIGDKEDHNGTFDFTGQICENTDRIAIKRSFPKVNEGDIISIMDVGAYGYSMSHNFNTRQRSAEILIDKDSTQLIRKRETINDIFALCNV